MTRKCSLWRDYALTGCFRVLSNSRTRIIGLMQYRGVGCPSRVEGKFEEPVARTVYRRQE